MPKLDPEAFEEMLNSNMKVSTPIETKDLAFEPRSCILSRYLLSLSCILRTRHEMQFYSVTIDIAYNEQEDANKPYCKQVLVVTKPIDMTF